MSGRITKNGGYILRSLLTTKGDMIVRGDYGPERFPAGAYGDTMVAVGSGEKPIWYSSSELLKVNLVDSIFYNEVGALVTQTASGYNVGKVSNGTAGQYLKCNGAGNIPSWDVPPKPIGSIYSPATGSSSPTTGVVLKGAFPVILMTTSISAHVSITVPDDFASIHSVYLFGIGDDNGIRTFKIDTNYGCSFEDYDNHSQTVYLNASLFSGKIFSINIASALTYVAANDQIGIRARLHDVGANDTGLIGAKFVYNRS